MTTITVPRAALEQALEALESLFTLQADDARPKRCGDAITAIRAALAQQEQEQEQEQEPAVFTVTKSGALLEWEPTTGAFELPDGKHFLYTSPPRREWQGLSEEEIADAQDAAAIQFRKSRHGVRGQQLMPSDSPDWWLARAIEAKLKEKNS